VFCKPDIGQPCGFSENPVRPGDVNPPVFLINMNVDRFSVIVVIVDVVLRRLPPGLPQSHVLSINLSWLARLANFNHSK